MKLQLPIITIVLGLSAMINAMEMPSSYLPEYKVQMSVGQLCPPREKISDLPGLESLRYAEKLPAHKQGANSTVYQRHDLIFKVSKFVAPADELSKELDDLEKTYSILRGLGLKNTGFEFAIPQKTYKIWSTDNLGMCFVEVSKALPTLVNKQYYDYINPKINRDSRTVFSNLGEALAQFQNSKPSTLDSDGFYYGLQHGDFQMGNIFYDPANHIFTLIDLGNVAEHKRLILDPLYLVYSLSITFDGKRERFIEELKDETKKAKISNMITAFINGYVSKLNPDVAQQINKIIQEKANPTDVFYLDGKYLYKGKDVMDGVRNNRELVEFFNPLIQQAFATAYAKTFGGKMVEPKVKLQEITPAQIKKSASESTKIKDSSIISLTQLPNLCTADKVKLDLSMYPELEDLTGISACENLKKLYLPGTKVSNIEEIASLKNLEELDLSGLSSLPVGEPKSLWILPLAGYTDYHGSAIKTHRYPGAQKLKILKVYGIKHVHGYDELKKELPGLDIRTKH